MTTSSFFSPRRSVASLTCIPLTRRFAFLPVIMLPKTTERFCAAGSDPSLRLAPRCCERVDSKRAPSASHIPLEENMRVVIYARVSTKDQSCDLQLRDLRAYCAARGISVLREYVDIGESGAKDSRPPEHLRWKKKIR